MSRTAVRALASFALVLACDTGSAAAGQVSSVLVPGSAGGAPTGGVQGSAVTGGTGPSALGQSLPRDPQFTLAVGSSGIRGRVLAADTGRPLRRAIVRVTAPNVRETRTATTDQDGQYSFTQLPAAAYLITASKSGYVQMGYLQTRPNTPPRPLPLGNRESKDNVDLSLPPGGVVTGRVVDEFGEPMTDVTVMAQRQQYVNGARRPVPVGSAPSTSNDIGEFRIYGLPPGDYYLSATPRGQVNPIDVSTDRTGYGQTYYPSTPDLASAQRVAVRSGDMISDIVIALTQTRVARVSGTVFDREGKPVRGGNIMASPSGSIGFPNGNAFVRPDGSFTIGGLAPGEYTLRAVLPSPVVALTPQGVSFSTATISVNGTDLTNVAVQPQVPIILHAHLTGDGATLAQISPAQTRFMAASVGPTFMPGPPGPPQPVNDDLTFELQAYPGALVIRPLTLTGLVVREVRLNGRDVTRGFELGAGAAANEVEVEVTGATGRLVTTATNVREEPVTDRDILVFPQDESKWGVQLPGHGSSGRTDQDGRFQSPPLLPGAYYVAAIDPPEPGQVNDPEYLESLRARAQRITIGAGETANVAFRVTER